MRRDSQGRFVGSGRSKKKRVYKPKGSGKNMVTLINYVLDQSGSMSTVKSSVISGFNEYLSTLRTKKNEQILFSLTLFDSNGADKIRLVKPFVATDVMNVQPLSADTYRPMGGTPLYDALDQACQDVDDVINVRGLKVNRVLTVVHTDGQENASKINNRASIKQLVQQKERTGFWSFAYIGAAESTWADAHGIGITRQNTIAYQPQDTRGIFASLGNSTMAYAASSNLQSHTVFSGGQKFDGSKLIDAKRRFEHHSSDGYTRYEATEWKDGTWSCNCPGWAFNKRCKHIGGGTSAIQKVA